MVSCIVTSHNLASLATFTLLQLLLIVTYVTGPRTTVSALTNNRYVQNGEQPVAAAVPAAAVAARAQYEVQRDLRAPPGGNDLQQIVIQQQREPVTTLDGFRVEQGAVFTKVNATRVRIRQHGDRERMAERVPEVRLEEGGGEGAHPEVRRDSYPGQRAKWKHRQRPVSKPSPALKQNIDWFEGSHTFAHRHSADSRLLIRHSPTGQSGSPWPMPQVYAPGVSRYRIIPDLFKFYATGEVCDILDFAFDRIRKNLFGQDYVPPEEREEVPREQLDAAFEDDDVERDADDDDDAWRVDDDEDDEYDEWMTFHVIKNINVTVLKECSQYPSLSSDESYDLEVKRTGVILIAHEVWGALRGLETFSQLVYKEQYGRYVVNRTSVHDFPRFPHRGVLLDTARHYLKKEVIIENLEAMAQNKMNVLHWHIVDDQSFPFQSKTFPNLTKYGAYDPETHIYTHRDIADILEEARLRGIRVIPEFDSPGHTLSWGFGQDYLLTPCYNYMNQPDGFFGPINPILKSTYQFLHKLFHEILHVFPDKYVHLGGDEVPFDCWSSNPQIMNFMRRNNLTNIEEVLSLYEKKLLEIISDLGNEREQGAGYIVWQEVVDNGVRVKPDTIVQIWMGDAIDIQRVTNMGLRVIYSTCWYLDYISYGMDWDKYYRCEHLTSQLERYHLTNESLLMGGEICLWTEYADDDSITPRIWPRASAAAERLWSHKRNKDPVEAAPRLEEHRCRMISRGIRTGVASGPGYCPEYKSKRRKSSHSERWFFWKKAPEAGTGRVQSSSTEVYQVDINAMYLVPVLLVVCLCCFTLISLAQQGGDHRVSRLVAILKIPGVVAAANGRRSVRKLLYVFLLFAVIWSIWTSPMWSNSWETKNHNADAAAAAAAKAH